MTALDTAVATAERLARSAAIANTGVQTCPYPPGSTGVQSAARRAWLRQYLKLRPQPAGVVSYQGDEEEPGDGNVVDGEGLTESASPAELSEASHDQLRQYWLHGAGLKKWAASPHPWTALYDHLKDHVTEPQAKRIAAQWYYDHFGHWPGEDRKK